MKEFPSGNSEAGGNTRRKTGESEKRCLVLGGGLRECVGARGSLKAVGSAKSWESQKRN